MSEYTVHFVTCASTSVRVQAEDPDDAIDRAYGDVYASLCHQCSRQLEVAGDWEPECVIDEESNDVVWERKGD